MDWRAEVSVPPIEQVNENGREIKLIPRPVRKNPPLQQMENAAATRIIFSVSD
jgi:hypothetical protein